MKRKFFILSITSATIVLIYFSEIFDLFFTDLFYQNGFNLRNNFLIQGIDAYMEYAVCLLYATVLGLWIFPRLMLPYFLQNKLSFITNKISVGTNQIIYLSLCFFGWCITLPYSFKIFFHRARPYQTNIYGGECSFTDAFEKSACQIGDSFISGHTSFALWLFALALILPSKFRGVCTFVAFSIVSIVAVTRVIGGYHYLTDVYFALLLVSGGILMTYRKIFMPENILNKYKIATL